MTAAAVEEEVPLPPEPPEDDEWGVPEEPLLVAEPRHRPPSDVNAERSVLGTILESGKLGKVTSTLMAEQFYRPAHIEIFIVIQEMSAQGVEVDAASVMRELETRQMLFKVGGAPYLHTLLKAAFTPAVGEHVRSIRDTAERRAVIAFSQRCQQLAHHRAVGLDSTEIVEKLRAELDVLSNATRRHKSSTVELGDLLHERAAAYDEPTPPGMSTGWSEIDGKLGGGVGMQPGRVYVIGARTGVGKTLVAINLAISAAHAKKRVAMFTLEMNRDEVGDRIIASAADIELKRLQNHQLTADDRVRLAVMMDDFGGDPMTIDDSAMNTIAAIRSTCRDLTRATPPLGIAVVDYLQLIHPADRKAPRQEQVSSISRDLKVMAKELRIPVVALAQLNREVESRPDKTPRLSDLRESGSLEQDADVVMLLHRKEDHQGTLTVTVAKNRSGPAGIDVPLDWDPSSARLRTPKAREEDPYDYHR